MDHFTAFRRLPVRFVLCILSRKPEVTDGGDNVVHNVLDEPRLSKS
jgi:hypothetical protein